ncbi:MAG: family 20 glycosylhydrolase [Bacteroidales bacterium]|nr:family 20 glycosylhydrolase [Bacteroidales bacterium]
MKNILCLLVLFSISFLSVANTPVISGLIPKPLHMKTGKASFSFTPKTIIYSRPGDVHTHFINDFMQLEYGFQLAVKVSKKVKSGINLIYNPSFADEAYRLSVTASSITIEGSEAGVFYGIQTLLQLMPVNPTDSIRIPCIEIEDKPRFTYRGALLDVARYFSPVEEIKRFIDLIASYKLNVFQWHLTDDQGWRIEIKKYSDLTRIGAWRQGTQQTHDKKASFDNLPHGGYYTQDQIRDVVRYAAERHITIIPEIDMPGHMLSALSAYPRLSCTGGPFHVSEEWDIEQNILCAGNEDVYTFVQDILDEVLDLFPSKIIHIGGDEAPKSQWKQCPKCQSKIKQENLKDEHELQSYFVKRIAAYLESKGRRLLGWEEIMQGGLAPNTMVMSWQGEDAGIEALRQCHEVVMSPLTYLYFDYCQGNPSNEPYSIGHYLPLEKVYSYEPLSEKIPVENQKYIIGVQANIWREFIHSETKIDYMAFPRLLALAEIGWSPKGKDYVDFTKRLSSNLLWLDKKGVNFRIPEPYGLKDTATSGENRITLKLTPSVEGSDIWFTTDGSDPLLNGIRYSTPFTLDLSNAPVTVTCVIRTPQGRVSTNYSAVYSKGEIPIVAWHGIPPEKSSDFFPLMKEVGINIYLCGYKDLNTTLKILDIAKSSGIKLITSCPELKSEAETTVKRLMSHPALYGYYLKDEPEMWDLPELGVWIKQIQAIDNNHPCYINLYPNWAWGKEKYAGNVETFLHQVPVPFLSFDQYPIVEVNGAPSILRPEWYKNLEEIAAAAKKMQLPVWAFALAWSHNLDSIHHYPAPTLPELRLQMFSNLAYGAQTLQYFTFKGAIDDNGKTPIYNCIKTVNREIQNLSGVFLGAKVISVWHTGALPEGTHPIDKLPTPIKSLTTSGGAVVSLLEKGDNQYLVIVNRNYRNSMELTVSIDDSVHRLMKDGSIAPIDVPTMQVDAGDMVIYTWKK